MPLYEFPNNAFPADIFDLGGDAQGNPGGTAWDAKEQVMRTIADTMGFKYVLSSAITDADVAAADFPCLIMDRRSDENDPPKYGLKDSSNIKNIAACKNPFTETNMQMLKMFFGADHELIKKKHRANVGLLIADGTASDDFGGGPYPDDTDASTGWVATGKTAGQPRMWRDLRDIAKGGDKVWDASKSEYVLFKGAGGGAAVFAGGSTFAISVNERQFLTGYTPIVLDADGNKLTGFTLTGTDASLFKINASGELEFTTAPNFSTPTDNDKDNIYKFSIEGSSGAKQEISVTVLDVKSNDSISGGSDHSLILLADGSVKSFGIGNRGQLGNGDTVDQSTPVSVTGITNAVAVSAGNQFSLVLIADGSVKSFGSGSGGKLGNGDTVDQSTPVSVTGITNAVAISAGYDHSLVVLADGTAKSFGSGSGKGFVSSVHDSTPVSIPGITNAVAVSAGYQFSLVLIADGTMMSFGRNASGQLGNGSITHTHCPGSVTGITNAVAISAGYDHSLVLLADGSVKSFGRGRKGELGNGIIGDQATPVSVTGITNAVAVSAGYQFSLVLIADGSVKSFGIGSLGQLGIGSYTSQTTTPVSVTGITNAVAVGAGHNFSLVLIADGSVKSFGYGSRGQLGNGDTMNYTSPTGVVGITNAVP